MSLRTVTDDPLTRDERIFRAVIAAVAVAAIAWSMANAIPQGDPRLYSHYAYAMLHGSLASGLPKEYPALAGVVFVTVSLLPLAYLPAFMATMSAALVALATVGERLVNRPGWCRSMVLYMVLGTGSVMLARYDLLPAGCAFVAVAMAIRGRFSGAWISAALGAALKIFPALLLPLLFIEEWRRTGGPPWRRLLALILAAGGFATAQAVFAPGTIWSPVRYEIKRGFEYSSVPATLTLILDPFRLAWHSGFGAWQIYGAGRAEIGLLMTAIEIALIAALYVLLYRRRLSIEAAALAVLSVAVITDRALAPQYLLWLAPLWALFPLRKAWLATCVLTTAAYPVAFSFASSSGPNTRDMLVATVVAALRNAFLIGATWTWIRSELRSPTYDRAPLGKRCLDTLIPRCYDTDQEVRGA